MIRRIALAAVAFASIGAAQVPYERIVRAATEPQNWLTYFGDYGGVRYRDLNQINTSNVNRLRVEWMFQTGQPGAFETVPLVVDGIMYLTAANGYAYALDARSGRQLWMYHYAIPNKAIQPNGSVNRGLAILGDRLFMTTPDGHVIALDVKTGHPLWEITMAPNESAHGATMAPLAAKDKVIVGVTGGEFGIRGFIDAYDPATGKRLWRFWTVPAKGEPGGETWLADSWKRGGGATWMTGTYDPQLNTLYWGVGNPGPDLNGAVRTGDNLYTASVVALDADTGKLKWYYQFSPHDAHDWDACETPMLLDIEWKGHPRKVLVQGNRNQFFYVLDRVTGEFLMAKPMGRQTWLKSFDEKGRPVKDPKSDPSPEGSHVCPGLGGGANWMAPSYSPQTKLFYVPLFEACDIFYTSAPVYVAGKSYWGSVSRGWTEERSWGVIKALDPQTGEEKWHFDLFRPSWAGTMATSGGLVFGGDGDGYFFALDANTGKVLWKLNTGNSLNTAPMTYMLGGRQYVVMPSGAALLAFALPAD